MIEPTSATTAGPGGTTFRQAFEKNIAAMAALRDDELRRVNVKIPTLVPRILGAMSGLRAIRAEIARKLPEHDLRSLDGLEELTLALAHSHALAMAATEQPAVDLVALSEEGTALRESLVADAHALARHRLLDEKSLESFKNQVGYRVVAFDLLAVASLLRQNWARIDGKTPISLDDLARAEGIACKIVNELAVREQKEEDVSGALQLRQRAYTLFYRAYNETRRAIAYLRWNEDDTDSICPPLFAARRTRRAKEAEQEEEQDAAPEQPRQTPSAPATPAAPAAPVGAGLPGSNPFMS